MKEDKITRVAELPRVGRNQRLALPEVPDQLRASWAGDQLCGQQLCVAGTISGYPAIVDRASFRYTIVSLGDNALHAKPYWSTESADGRNCYVSVSEQDRVSVISFDDAKEIASMPVGGHPQRVRNGKMLLVATTQAH